MWFPSCDLTSPTSEPDCGHPSFSRSPLQFRAILLDLRFVRLHAAKLFFEFSFFFHGFECGPSCRTSFVPSFCRLSSIVSKMISISFLFDGFISMLSVEYSLVDVAFFLCALDCSPPGHFFFVSSSPRRLLRNATPPLASRPCSQLPPCEMVGTSPLHALRPDPDNLRFLFVARAWQPMISPLFPFQFPL